MGYLTRREYAAICFLPPDTGAGASSDADAKPDDHEQGKDITETGAAGADADKGGEDTSGKEKKDGRAEPWFMRRLTQSEVEKREAERRAKEAEADNRRLRAQIEKGGEDDKQPSTLEEMLASPEGRAAIERAAISKADERAIVRASDDVYDRGCAKHADFHDTIGTFRAFGGLRQDLVRAVTKVPNGEDVMYQLGKNGALIEKLYALEPVDLAVEVARISNELIETNKKPKPQVSNAKEPIEPVAGGTNVPFDLASKDTSMADWVREREADLQKRNVRI